VLTEVNSTKHCLEWMLRSVHIAQTDVLTIIIGTTVLLLTIRQSPHDWRPERRKRKQGNLTDINPSGIKATPHQGNSRERQSNRDKQLHKKADETL